MTVETEEIVVSAGMRAVAVVKAVTVETVVTAERQQ